MTGHEFDSYAKDYDSLLHDPLRDGFVKDPAFYTERKWLLIQEFFRQRGQSLSKLDWLDVGCGRGELLALGKSHFNAAQGCDPSQEMLNAISGISVEKMPDATSLPFGDGIFDFVTAVCVYHHVELSHRMQLMQEMRRVLKPGGIVCVIEHNPYNPGTQLIVRRSPMDKNAILLRAGETRNIMRGAALEIVSTKFFLYLPEVIFRKMPDLEPWLVRVPLGGQYAVFAKA